MGYNYNSLISTYISVERKERNEDTKDERNPFSYYIKFKIVNVENSYWFRDNWMLSAHEIVMLFRKDNIYLNDEDILALAHQEVERYNNEIIANKNKKFNNDLFKKVTDYLHTITIKYDYDLKNLKNYIESRIGEIK